MPPRKRQLSTRAESPTPERFFEKQLVGEEPPSRSSMEELYLLAMNVFERKPWELLADSDLIAVRDPVSGELCFCSIMGALGEAFVLQAFIGSGGIAAFRAIASGAPDAPDTFHAVARTVYAELALRAELEPPDRALLTALNHPVRHASRVPVFRSVRPGYLPWYMTDAEAKLLAHCIRAVGIFLDYMDAHPDERPWDEEDYYPLVQPNGELSRIKMPGPSAAVVEMPKMDEQRIQRIKRGPHSVKGILELDHFYGPGCIGKIHERKACMGLALVLDAKTAFAYPPRIGAPGQPIAELLADALLGAIEKSGSIPTEVRVRGGHRSRELEALGTELGFRVRAVPSLPALDFCKQELLGMMRSDLR